VAFGAGWQSRRRDGGTDEHELAEARAEKGWAATSRRYRSVGKREVMEKLRLAMDVSGDGWFVALLLGERCSNVADT
jgi:hypothetical protein